MAALTFASLAVLIACTAILRFRSYRVRERGLRQFFTPVIAGTTVLTVIAFVLSVVFLGMWIWDIAHHRPVAS